MLLRSAGDWDGVLHGFRLAVLLSKWHVLTLGQRQDVHFAAQVNLLSALMSIHAPSADLYSAMVLTGEYADENVLVATMLATAQAAYGAWMVDADIARLRFQRGLVQSLGALACPAGLDASWQCHYADIIAAVIGSHSGVATDGTRPGFRLQRRDFDILSQALHNVPTLLEIVYMALPAPCLRAVYSAMEAVDRTASTATEDAGDSASSGLTSGHLSSLRTRDKSDSSFMLHEGGWLLRLEAVLEKQRWQRRAVRCSNHTQVCSLVGTDALRAMLRRMRVRLGSAKGADPTAVRVARASAASPAHAELRVAYVSGDFRSHSVGYHMHGLLAAHRRGLNGLQVLCYNPGNMDFVDSPDNATMRYLSTVQWHRVQSSNETRASADETRVNIATMEEALGRENGKGSYRTQSLFRHSAPPSTVRSEVVRARLAAELRDRQHSDHISAVHRLASHASGHAEIVSSLSSTALKPFGDVDVDYSPVGSADRHMTTPYLNALLPDVYARAVSKMSPELGSSYPGYADAVRNMRNWVGRNGTAQDAEEFARMARRLVTEQRENANLKTTEKIISVCDAYYGTPGCMTSAFCSLSRPAVPDMAGPNGANEHIVARHMRSKARVHLAVDLNGRSQGHVQMMWRERPAPISIVYLGAPVSVFDPDASHFMASDARSAPPDMIHRTLYDGMLWSRPDPSYIQNAAAIEGGVGGFTVENFMAGEPELDEHARRVNMSLLISTQTALGRGYSAHIMSLIRAKSFPANDVLGACEARFSVPNVDGVFENAELENDLPRSELKAVRNRLRQAAVVWPVFSESIIYLPRVYHVLTVDSISMPAAICDKYAPLFNEQIRVQLDSKRSDFFGLRRLYCGPSISSCGNTSQTSPLVRATPKDSKFEGEWDSECPPSVRFNIAAFHTVSKFEGRIMHAWLNILQRSSPCAVLWLLQPKGLDSVGTRLLEEVAARGIHPKRIVFKGAKYGQDTRETIAPIVASAHVYLDAHIYGAHSTAGDLLVAGVPIVTLITDNWAGRVAMSMVEALDTAGRVESRAGKGPSELSPSLHLVAHGYTEYEEMAVRLTTNLRHLATLSTTMVRRLFNGSDHEPMHVGNDPSSPRLYPNGRPHQLIDYSARAQDLERTYRAAYEWRAIREIAERGFIADGDGASGASFPSPGRSDDYAFGSIPDRIGSNHRHISGAGLDMHLVIAPQSERPIT
jgi:hypothetical protein